MDTSDIEIEENFSPLYYLLFPWDTWFSILPSAGWVRVINHPSADTVVMRAYLWSSIYSILT
jgi:hypothetical protein